MPDTLTHLLVAIPIARKFFQRPWRYIFYLGAVLPDLLSRGLSSLFKNVHDYFMPLHTPVGLMVFVIFFMAFFEKHYWKKVSFYLSMGVVSHLILDALQSHDYSVAYLWLFPFSWRSYKGGLFEPHVSLYFLPILLAIVFFMEVRRLIKARRL